MKFTKDDIEKVKNIKLLLENTFNELEFDEESHSYTLDGEKLVSTTTFLDSYTNSFDSYHMSESKAMAYNKKNPHLPPRQGVYYRKRWRCLATEASSQGSRVHSFSELYPYFDEPDDDKEKAVIDFFKYFDTRYILIAQEIKVYNKQYKKAGTVDLLAYDTVTKNLVIFDWKTNNSNILECYANKKLPAPFDKALSCSLNKYAIQMSDYKNMIEMATGLKVDHTYVVWLTTRLKKKKGNYTYETQKAVKSTTNYKLYLLKDFTKELKSLYAEPISKSVQSTKKNTFIKL